MRASTLPGFYAENSVPNSQTGYRAQSSATLQPSTAVVPALPPRDDGSNCVQTCTACVLSRVGCGNCFVCLISKGSS
jgi:hypothetical protein